MTRREQNVYCAIVADSGSRRHAGRLAQVLRTRSSAFVDFLDAHEVEKTLPQLPRNARIVFVGDNAFSRYIRRSLQLGYSRWGVRWATKGRMACIWSEKDEPDTDELLHEIRKELDECRMLTRSLRGSLMDEDDSRGPMYAARSAVRALVPPVHDALGAHRGRPDHARRRPVPPERLGAADRSALRRDARACTLPPLRLDEGA
jgi:hypothetical protein